MDRHCMLACVYLFFYTLFFVCRLLYKDVKIKIYENIIFPIVCFCWVSKLVLSHWRKNVGWGCWEDGVLRTYIGCGKDEVTGGWINLNDGGFLISTKSCRAVDRIQQFINTSDSEADSIHHQSSGIWTDPLISPSCQMSLGWQVKEDEVGEACDMRGREEKNSYGASVKKAWVWETDCKT